VSDEPRPPAAPVFDIGDYCRQVESHLTRVNAGHLVRIVGPAFELVRQWAEEGIPLSVVFRGIDLRAGRHRTRQGKRPLRIEFCEADVRDLFDGWRRAVGLPRGGEAPADSAPTEAAEPRRRSLTRHLDRAIERLAGAAGRLDLPDAFRAAADPLLREIVALRDGAKKARGPARDEIAARLPILDAALVQAAAQSAPADVIDALRVEAEQDLAPYRDRLSDEAWQRSIGVTVTRLLRDRYGLPTLEL
jgi:hypothetical protein